MKAVRKDGEVEIALGLTYKIFLLITVVSVRTIASRIAQEGTTDDKAV